MIDESEKLIDCMLLQAWLEKCTDTCKDESDMPCLNDCGDRFVSDTDQDFKQILMKYKTND